MGLAVVLSQNGASASVPPCVVSSTVKAAGVFAAGQPAAAGLISASVVALTEGVLKAMLLRKLTTATVGLLMIVAFSGGAGLVHETRAADKVTTGREQIQCPVCGHVQPKGVQQCENCRGQVGQRTDQLRVMVFKYPARQPPAYFKRLIGLPGDTIRIENGKIDIMPKTRLIDAESGVGAGGLLHQTEAAEQPNAQTETDEKQPTAAASPNLPEVKRVHDFALGFGMSDIQAFLFAEAWQTRRQGESVYGFARRMGMSEIHAFLLAEAWQGEM
jgi:hypothetical protein